MARTPGLTPGCARHARLAGHPQRADPDQPVAHLRPGTRVRDVIPYEPVTDHRPRTWPGISDYGVHCDLQHNAGARGTARAAGVVTNPDPPGRIMVVDDDRTLAEVVGRYLVRDGHRVECLHDGPAALRRIEEEPPDLVVLDLMLPGVGGLDVCAQLRARWPIPVVMLTALGEETDKIIGFETGADDYMTKPFSPRELVLRVRSVLRRARGGGLHGAPPHGVIGDGDLEVDLGAHQVSLGRQLVALTSLEYDLLVFLIRHPRQAFTREELLEQVWNWSFGDTSTVTVHVRRLREKLEADPTLPQRIVTVWGVGYRYEPEAA
jgi:DNA-binding response OmpR family regulator